MNILKQNKLKKLLITAIIQAMVFLPVFAIDLDYTVDDDIRKNYKVDEVKINNTTPATKSTNTSKSISNTTVKTTAPVSTQKKETLPKLPELPKTITNTPVQTSTPTTRSVITRTQQKKYSVIPLRKNTEIDITNINAISDKQKKGTNIVFVSQKPIKTPYYTIPQGTKFVGRITNSKTPQITGNGGLVSIEVITIILANQYQHIDTRITKVNGEKIFFENIKGERTYIKNTINKGKWGRNTFHKMNKLSSNLIQDKTTVILAPFTFLYGGVMGCISTVTSPVISIFCKGGHVNIPVNTSFRIKFIKDAKVKVSL